MGTVHVRICHNDNLVIAQFRNVEILMDSRTESCDHRFDLRIGVNFVKAGFLHIQNLTAKRKDCLRCAASRRLCGTTRRISLNNINFTVFRIFIGTVSQFSGKRRTLQSGLTACQISCLSGSIPCPLRQNRLLTDNFGNRRILLQKVSELFTYNIVNSTSRLRISEFLFRLSLKLRIFNLNADDSGQSLSDIFT